MNNTEHWNDWRWQLLHAITTPDETLCDRFHLNLADTERVAARYPLLLTPYTLAQLNPDDPTDPINLQMLPHPDELTKEAHAVPDPFQECSQAACCYGMKQRFPDRVLIMANDQCAMACRHCTRKNLLCDAEVIRSQREIDAAVIWIQSHPQVREVLLSGGDPLLLSDSKILKLVETFAALPQIDAVRIGSRVLSTLPMRITTRLARQLGKTKKVWINTQFNHPREMTAEARLACARLVDAGIPLSNQSVLLRGVNDNLETLFELCATLQRNRVRPYYVFVCDPVEGIAPFRVPVKHAAELERALAEKIGGLALPRFVADLPDRKRKTPVSECISGNG